MNYLTYQIIESKVEDVVAISQKNYELPEESVFLTRKELMDIIKFVIEEGFLDWDCSECPIQ